LFVDLNSEELKSPVYQDIKAKVITNKNNFPDLKTEYGFVYRKAEYLSCEA